MNIKGITIMCAPLLTALVAVAALATAVAVAAVAAAAAADPPADSGPLKPPMTAAQVITVLDQTVDWYRTLGLQQQAASDPSDLLILYDNRQTATKVLGLAFDLARANADMLSKNLDATNADTDNKTDSNDATTSSNALLQLQKKLDGETATVQAELDALQHPSPPHAGAKKPKVDVQAKVHELQGELDLINTKRNIVNTMVGFAGEGGNSTAGALRSQIDAMAVALPATIAGGNPASSPSGSSPGGAGPTPPAPAAAPAAPATAAQPPSASSTVTAVGTFGLWDLALNAFRLSEKANTVDGIDKRTAALQATLAKIRSTLLDQIKTLSARGDALAAAAESADATTLNGVHDQLDDLSAQFKQVSALLLPLSREGVLLNQYRHNLDTWRDTIRTETKSALKTLGIRLAILLVILGLLFGAAELWQRTVIRYIQDTRRRYQLLLLRRIALWSLVVIVVGFAFASELGSIVTFAGLITAGIAVAMQSVLVSIVGYFFLIGKYGIRVGDRVQIGEVAGEVIDLGLVRMYLMELGAKGASGPTGRVVAFANSVVFQVASGLFKQIPGVNFGWREVVLNLPAGVDYAAIKERLLTAITTALADYLPEIERQTREIERTTMSTSAGDAKPQVQLHFSGSTVEAHVRYPVHLAHAAEIDERVTESLTHVMQAAALAAAAAAPPPANA